MRRIYVKRTVMSLFTHPQFVSNPLFSCETQKEKICPTIVYRVCLSKKSKLFLKKTILYDSFMLKKENTVSYSLKILFSYLSYSHFFVLGVLCLELHEDSTVLFHGKNKYFGTSIITNFIFK